MSLLKVAGTTASSGQLYVNDVFSVYLYTGTGAAQTITNGIDLAGKGGLVWLKPRSVSVGHALFDSNRGTNNYIASESTNAQSAVSGPTFTSTGFILNGSWNGSPTTYASWTFRKAAKFFDVVTWTGDGTGVKTVTHNLGSVPGCIIVKHTSEASSWWVYHRGTVASGSPAQDQYLRLETTDQIASSSIWNNYAPTSTNFQVNSGRNTSGQTYVAYIFAHDAGGFGLTGTENVITCGYYLGNGAAGGQNISLGYEPQYLMTKIITDTGDWNIADNMRGWTLGSTAASTDAWLQANTSANETQISLGYPTSTGFQVVSDNTNRSGRYYIYIAIRRPNKPPTSGTQVFMPAYQNDSTPVATGFVTDMFLEFQQAYPTYNTFNASRLTYSGNLRTASVQAEEFGNLSDNNFSGGNSNTALSLGIFGALASIFAFKRAPGFFDVVCYTGTGAGAALVSHNLQAVPEFAICKRRDASADWIVWQKDLSIAGTVLLNSSVADSYSNQVNGHIFPYNPPSDFRMETYLGASGVSAVNASGGTYVMYLFATLAGIQYINSYVGDGTTGRVINCGFSAGARFICIKATSTTGSWWVWDSARGITSTNDPALQLNSTAAEITSADAIDPSSSGFIVNQEATCSINASGVSYLVWAIA